MGASAPSKHQASMLPAAICATCLPNHHGVEASEELLDFAGAAPVLSETVSSRTPISPNIQAAQDKLARRFEPHEKTEGGLDDNLDDFVRVISERKQTVVEACTQDIARGLRKDELVLALSSMGLYPTAEELESCLAEEDLLTPLAIQDFPQVVDHFHNTSCRKGPRNVPHSLRGVSLKQLLSLSSAFVESGWLQAQCATFNKSHKAAIENETVPPMRENVTALDTFVVRRVTSPDISLRRVIPPARLEQCDIAQAPLFETSYSELVNPSGIAVHFFVSHYWEQLFSSTLTALWSHAKEACTEDSPMDVAFWMCVFALNPHRVQDELGERIEHGPFNIALSKASAGMLLLFDSDAAVLERTWCLYEVARADDSNRTVHLAMLPTSDAGSAADTSAERVCEQLLTISGLRSEASSHNDTAALKLQMLNLGRRKPFADIPDEAALTDDHFSAFNEKVRVKLATTFFQQATQLGQWDAAVRYLGAGASCSVVDLQRIDQMGGALKVPVRTVLFGAQGIASLLYIMAAAGKTQEVAYLISKGLVIEHQASFPGTPSSYKQMLLHKSKPLGAAVACGRLDAVRLLLESRADVACKSAQGWSPLHCACVPSPDSLAISNLLVEHGGAPQEDRRFALNAAAFLGNAKVLDLLLQTSGDVDLGVDEDGTTLLHQAARGGSAQAVVLLLSHRADVNTPDRKGDSAAQVAKRNGFGSLAGLLGNTQRGETFRAEALALGAFYRTAS